MKSVYQRMLQTYLVDSGAPLHEDAPASARLAPDVEVGVDAHHARSDRPSWLEYQDPRTVEEQEYSEAELHLKTGQLNWIYSSRISFVMLRCYRNYN